MTDHSSPADAASPFSLAEAYIRIHATSTATTSDSSVLPAANALVAARSSLPPSLPATGLGDHATLSHILGDLAPAFSSQALSPHYYGFVTGGVLPIAEAADNVVSRWDQNVQVHLPGQTISTAVEDRALRMLVEAVGLHREWAGASAGRTFTTGATASNVLGLACGREAVVGKRLRARGFSDGVAEWGLLKACLKAGVEEVQVLTTMGHSSLHKAASVVGLGRASVKDVGLQAQPWVFDMQRLEEELAKEKEATVSIVAVSCGEVNTGGFASRGLEDMQRIRALCDRYGAWLHVDAGKSLLHHKSWSLLHLSLVSTRYVVPIPCHRSTDGATMCFTRSSPHLVLISSLL